VLLEAVGPGPPPPAPPPCPGRVFGRRRGRDGRQRRWGRDGRRWRRGSVL